MKNFNIHKLVKQQDIYENLSDFYFNQIPDNILHLLHNDSVTYNEIILESLNSSETSVVINQLKKYYVQFIESVKIMNNNSRSGFIINLMNIFNVETFLDNNLEIYNLLNFYGYYISKYLKNSILISPTYASIANDILQQNHNICYHFTNSKKIDSILENGLRCKNNFYRYFPERIYFYITLNIFDNQGNLKTDVKKFLTDIDKTEDIYAIKVNLNNTNIPVYQDDVIDNPYSIFTYHNILTKYLTLINKKISVK